MHCCARNIERLTRIPKLRTDLQPRFVACSFHPLKSSEEARPSITILGIETWITVTVTFRQGDFKANEKPAQPALWPDTSADERAEQPKAYCISESCPWCQASHCD